MDENIITYCCVEVKITGSESHLSRDELTISPHTTDAASCLYLAHVSVNEPKCEHPVKGFRSQSGCIIAT